MWHVDGRKGHVRCTKGHVDARCEDNARQTHQDAYKTSRCWAGLRVVDLQLGVAAISSYRPQAGWGPLDVHRAARPS